MTMNLNIVDASQIVPSSPTLQDYEKRLERVRDMVAAQTQDGNWNFNEAMFGYANGLVLSLAVMEGRMPAFLDRPAVWLEDAKRNNAVVTDTESE